MFMGVIMYEIIYYFHPCSYMAHRPFTVALPYEADPGLVCDGMEMNFPSTVDWSYPVHSAQSSSQDKGTAP